MKKVLLAGFLALAAMLISVPVQASATACFDFDCVLGTPLLCEFDPTCSTGTPYVWKVRWNFGDGTDTGLTGPYGITHQYGPLCYPLVTLTVYTLNTDVDSVACLISTGYGQCPGPPLPVSGRCSN